LTNWWFNNRGSGSPHEATGPDTLPVVVRMIYFLCFYVWLFIHRPFEYYPQLGELQFERIYMIVMVVVWALTPGKGWLPNRIHLALACFTAVMLLSWAASPYADRESILENYFKVVTFYVLVVTSVRDEKGLRLLMLSYLVAVGLYASHSLLEFLNGRIEWRQGISRMVGVDVSYRDPNAFAYTLLTALPMTMPFWSEKGGVLRRPLLLGYTGLSVLCILLTGSRAAFAGLCFFGLMAILISGGSRKGVLLLAGLGALAIGTLLPGPLQNRFMTLIDSSYGPANAQLSAGGRIEGFLAGVELWQQSPLLGFGPVAFFAVATGREGGAHNLYGQLLSELGTLGALAFAGLIWCFWRNTAEARRFFRERPRAPRGFAFYVARAVGITIVLMLLLGWAGHNLYRYNWLWLAAFQAVALHCIRTREAVGAPAAVRVRCPHLPAARRPVWFTPRQA
jgi:O-antigen ligase